MKHSNAIVSFFDEILNEKKCFELAKRHKFIERSSSKLKGHEFIKTMIIPSEGLSTDSLNGLCLRIKEFNPEVDISAQALCERINDVSAKDLMQSVYSTILAYINSTITNYFSELNVLNKFNSVLIEDSTLMKLNEKLQEHFQGTKRGGKGLKSQVKIDLIYDLKRGGIVNAKLYNGNEPDQSLAGRIIKFLKPGDLVIRDQGYFVLNAIQEIIEREAFFISRLLPNVKIYLRKDDLKPINLAQYIEKHYSNCEVIDIPEVFLGAEKVRMRLVLYRLPKEVVEQRLRDANKRAKDMGRTMSKEKKFLLAFAAFVTNVSKECISAEILGTIYRLRWEIELVFKRWKSQLHIDYLKGINVNRIECLIWSRLCCVLIIEIANGYIAKLAEKVASEREISEVKVLSYLLRKNGFRRSVAQNRIEEFFDNLAKDIPRRLLKDKRRRKTIRERVEDFERYYVMQPSENQWVA